MPLFESGKLLKEERQLLCISKVRTRFYASSIRDKRHLKAVKSAPTVKLKTL